MIPPLPFEQEEPLLMRGEEAVQAVDEILRQSPLDVFHAYIAIFIVAFFVTLLATPLMRKLALANGIVDHPDDPRKAHMMPIAYMGGVAVFLGIIAGIALSYVAMDLWYHPDLQIIEMHDSVFDNRPVPFSLLLGMTVIMLTGLIDDVVGLSPRFKIGGQLLAAAAMAMENIGTKVAAGVMRPIGDLVGNQDLVYHIALPNDLSIMGSGVIELDLVYWAGTAIIAIFILGACNASNLIDGLDGLLSGVTAVATAGLLVIAVILAAMDDGPMDSARVVLCMALLGACLGFLPHNFNPATIFLGDAGSLLLGFCVIAIVLTLGDTGRTHLVIAGLIIYSIPIIDTVLAIVRRKLAGVSMSSADDQHLHHQLKRTFGVKGAVLVLYGIGAVFAVLGVWLSMGRVRVVFTIALVIASFIAVTAVKIARREALERQVRLAESKHRKHGGGGAGGDGAEAAERRPKEMEPV